MGVKPTLNAISHMHDMLKEETIYLYESCLVYIYIIRILYLPNVVYM